MVLQKSVAKVFSGELLDLSAHAIPVICRKHP